MAQFIGYLEGARGHASRCGTKNSGLAAKAQGWRVGGRVSMRHSGLVDRAYLELTSGSDGRGLSLSFGEWTRQDLEELGSVDIDIEAVIRRELAAKIAEEHRKDENDD
jgi:hypothetical protein